VRLKFSSGDAQYDIHNIVAYPAAIWKTEDIARQHSQPAGCPRWDQEVQAQHVSGRSAEHGARETRKRTRGNAGQEDSLEVCAARRRCACGEVPQE
jgi:hypothetical protein